jgi:hypothetical protein
MYYLNITEIALVMTLAVMKRNTELIGFSENQT